MVFAIWYDLRTSYGRTIRPEYTCNGQTMYRNDKMIETTPRSLGGSTTSVWTMYKADSTID
jgi:hypothetical protein